MKTACLSYTRVFGLLLGVSVLSAALPVAAQTFTAAVWEPYTDKYGLIHSKPVQPPPPPGGPSTAEPSTNNGLLYTAEASVIMQLRNVTYDKAQIAAGVKASQVVPGLFNRSPGNHSLPESQDDYIGLGALAGVCGFHDIARDILNYGKGDDQPSGPAVRPLDNGDFGSLSDEIKQCRTVPYNYNNVAPGNFHGQCGW